MKTNSYRFHFVGVSGTFDHFHKGHKRLISEAFGLSDQVAIGITTDQMAEKKLNAQFPPSRLLRRSRYEGPTRLRRVSKIQKYPERKREVERFLRVNGLWARAEFVEIRDVYGSAVEDDRLEAIVLTEETRKGGETVNKKRVSMGKHPLNLIIVPVLAASDGKKIASERIRDGDIDREGNVYTDLVNAGPISRETRPRLKDPIGKLILGDPSQPSQIWQKLKAAFTDGSSQVSLQGGVLQRTSCVVITVGDEVTKLLVGKGIVPDLAVVDLKVNRKKKYDSVEDLGYKDHLQISLNSIRVVRNQAGSISPSLKNAVFSAIHQGIEIREISLVKFATKFYRVKVIRVIGEDDLAGIPAILFAPLGSVVIYGQPGEGVVVVEVTEEKKQQIVEIITK